MSARFIQEAATFFKVRNNVQNKKRASMSEPDYQSCNCRNSLADQETWEIILDPAFCNDPAAADCLAHLLFVLKKAIAGGPEESMRVINTLQDGLRMVWPYTEEHKLAWELYEIYLSGDLKPWDEPRQLLEGALERFKGKSKARRPKVTRQRSGRRKRSSGQARG